MNKLVIAILASGLFVGCGDDGRNGRNGFNGQSGPQGSSGINGSDGSNGVNGTNGGSCHVEQVSKKCAKITCDDGSEAFAGNCEHDGEGDEE